MDGSQDKEGLKGRNGEQSSCPDCQRPDSAEDMVQCDHCDVWKHFTCAGVNASVAGRAFVCGDFSAQHTDDAITLVERQQMERARMELELQRRLLDEQQKLIDKAFGDEEEENHHGDGLSGGTTNEVTPPAPSKRLATPSPPGAPLASSDRRSKALSDTPKSAAPVVVSIPLTALEPNSVKLLQGMKDPQVARRELRARVELCEKRANPTPDDLVDLQAQLELCRKILEGIQTSTSTNESVQRPDASSTMKLQPPKPAASTSRMVKQIGAIPKTNRSLLTVPQEDRMQPNSPSQEGAVGGANRPSDIWPLKLPVSQSGRPSVSRAFESSKMRANLLEPPGKRQALSNMFENTTLFASGDYPTTKFPTTREQQRVDQRPGESCLPPTHSHEQLRDTLAHSGYTTLPYRQPERNSTGMQTRNCPSRVVESTPPPRQSDSSEPNQVISQPDPFRRTQQQLAARQSLAKDLPRFSGDPAEWPIFISNYHYTTEACGFSDGENMLRLQRCLTGSALETVRSRLVLPAAVPQVIETLRMRFGRPELLINALLRKVREIPAPRPDRLEGLIDFGMAVQALCDHIEAANERAHLSNPSLLQELVAKLPADQRMMWAGYKRGFPHADLKTFGDYMSSVVRDATSVVTFEPDTKRSGARDRPRQKGFINSHATESSSRSGDSSREPKETPKQFDCTHCNKCGHRVRDCSAFKQLNVDDRWRRVRSLGLCQNCLFSHGRLTLHGTKGSIDTFAFLDEGSDLTLIESDLVVSLGVKGTQLPLCLRLTGNTSRVEKESQQITIEIAEIGQGKRHKLLNVRTVNSLGLPRQTFEVEDAVKKHKHLQGIPLSSYRDAVPKILIGVDNLRLALPLKVREGDGPAPVAVKTRLGWCVYSPRGSSSLESHSFHICECSCDETLHEAVKDFFAIEGAGAGPTATSMKKEDERSLTIMEATTHRVGNRFETGLIWKEDHVEFPNSYSMAVRRLECLERRMERDPGLKENLHRQIQEYEAKGYAHKATAAEMEAADPRRVWHLPVGAVINPKKPGKVRVIWDAAAKVDGVSLNSALLKGPDQLSSLPAILFRFRLYQVAVSSDIQEMFHQIQIREADKNSQRFLWRNNPSEKPTVYLMDVATFGSTCSPASAQFVKNRNAEQHRELYPEAVKAIIDDHYVDDYLASFGTEEEATKVARDVRHVHGNGGFKLHNWRSNSCTVLERPGEVPLAEEKQLKLVDGVATERVLGMLWCPSTDELSFSTQMSEEVQALIKTSTRPTKRQVLRCVMTLFDPLGLLSPFLIHGKVLIQDIWREGTEWDEQVSADVFAKWRRWVQMIEYISGVRISRCYFRLANQKTYLNCELHVFVDANSRTALAWIMADPRNYRQFVSYRVAEILEHTTASDWRWAPSKSNPADEATKWGSGPYFNPNSKWFQGPELLRLPETEWPRPKEPVTATSEEIRASILHHCSIEPIAALSTKASNETGQEAIGKQSSIYRLMPILDENGLLRERGRIGAAGDICYSVRHPIILPRKHQVTELLVYRYHQQYRHGNAETVVNEIRQMYNIPRLRLVVKKVSRDCPFCKIRRARPAIPPMAPLPAARLAHHERAFTYTGVDYFGPLLVKLGRSNVKRWIALFTCLTVRAVHLEVAYTLSTESCISCVRRFVGRRGSPAEFFSDNGTNFQGAERVLRHQISQGLSSTFTNTNTKWNFIPPGAPHMGGAWERLVQSVKVAIAEAYSEGKLDDEGLQTLVVEAEHMVNSRPLTYLPLETVEAEALTPNHFLLLSSSGVKQYGRGVASAVHSQSSVLIRREILGRSWELIQRQLDVFWKRWLTEYLPVIRRQPKWFDESRPLTVGDLVMVAEPTTRNGWERGRIVRTIPNPDGRHRQAVVKIENKTLLRPMSRLALLDIQKVREVPEESGLHPGETVDAESDQLATLPPTVSEAPRYAFKAPRQCE
ncbi:uncharacterized protein LOC134288235 [Aedes albopictus]|uniref:Endonuclease n=1 Tax=Aedes albopictus TaxID=7160 RepID=A0ABM2A3L9_AEDAL